MNQRTHAVLLLTALLLPCLTAGPVLGQAAFDSEHARQGGFGGPVLMFSSVNRQDVVLLGFHGGWIINLESRHSFILGLGAYGVMSDVALEGVLINDAPVDLGMDYGGLEVGYEYRVTRLIRSGARMLFGAGGVGYNHINGVVDKANTNDGFFVLEPGVYLSLNVARFLRFAGGVQYRSVGSVHLEGVESGDLSGFAGMVTLQAGRF